MKDEKSWWDIKKQEAKLKIDARRFRKTPVYITEVGLYYMKPQQGLVLALQRRPGLGRERLWLCDAVSGFGEMCPCLMMYWHPWVGGGIGLPATHRTPLLSSVKCCRAQMKAVGFTDTVQLTRLSPVCVCVCVKWISEWEQHYCVCFSKFLFIC